MNLLTAEEVAKAAGVEPSFVLRAVESGALGAADPQVHFTSEDATRLRFLTFSFLTRPAPLFDYDV